MTQDLRGCSPHSGESTQEGCLEAGSRKVCSAVCSDLGADQEGDPEQKNVSGTVNLKAVRTLLRKGPQLLKAAPPVGGQGLNHMGLCEVFHVETTAGHLQGLAGREDMGHFVEIHSATRRQL